MQKDKNFEENKDINALIDDTKSELSEYVEKRLKSIRLRAYETTAIAGSYITYGLVVILMAYFIFFLFLLSLGYLLGEWLNSNAAGFGILIVLSSIGLFIFLKRGKSFRRTIANLVVSIIKKVESDEE